MSQLQVLIYNNQDHSKKGLCLGGRDVPSPMNKFSNNSDENLHIYI